jgi:peptidyl-prolyl cis-trans isomerase B (cyclophilin B)
MKGLKLFLGLSVLLFLSSCAKPIANFTYNASKKEAPSKVEFDNLSEKADSYLWEFGDGKTSSEEKPSHKYISSGNYTVKLTAVKGKKKNTIEKNLALNAPKNCLVQLETDHGTMTILLYDETPLHRDNFIKLAEEGFYNDLIFHRVINGFMIQGGDPNSKNAKKNTPLGSGGPGYQIKAEFNPKYVHVKGALAAARTGDASNPERKSSGSQFYIVDGKPYNEEAIKSLEFQKGIKYSDEQKKILIEQGGTPFLDMDYTVFGRVIEGLEVIDKIAAAKTNRGDRPQEDIKMNIKVVY